MKRGFTLIELLAVIIILAVIAIIATPIILNVVNDAKESARKSSVLGYADAVRLTIVDKTFSANGTAPNVDLDWAKENVSYKGEIVSCEKIHNHEQYGVILHQCQVGTHSKKYCVAKGKIYDCNNQEYNNIYNNVINSYQIGDLLTIEVGSGILEKFHLLAIHDDGTITAMYYKNLGIYPVSNSNNSSWINQSDYLGAGGTTEDWNKDCLNCGNKNKGPITANKILEQYTTNWNYVKHKSLPNAIDILNITKWYQKLSNKDNWQNEYLLLLNDLETALTQIPNVENIKTYEEYKEAYISAGFGDILLPKWVIVNTFSSGDCNTYGYWTESTIDAYSGYAWAVGYDGGIGGVFVSDQNNVGVRPKIIIDSTKIKNYSTTLEYVSSDICS